ncbi:hypothetical protein, partial [Legionella pneumophila]
NSEVKHFRANDSVRLPHAKVGHRQGFIPYSGSQAAFFIYKINYIVFSTSNTRYFTGSLSHKLSLNGLISFFNLSKVICG